LRFQYPHDYNKPQIKGSFPGPKHLEALTSSPSISHENFTQMQRFINIKKSKGNYFVDTDGNVVLDLHCNYGSLPLGYNHDAFINVKYHL
jgi:4-aminobutyrate aminotransferase-like enzyme